MPLPLIVGAIAVVAGATGVAKGVSGAKKIKEAKEDIERIERRHKSNQNMLKEQEEATQLSMDALGKKEVEVMASFDEFSSCMEKIIDKPDFATTKIGDKEIKPLTIERLKEVSIGAEALKALIAGSSMGTAGGLAAGGATSAAISAFGVASTGTAIGSLSGAAATNATLAAIGGGSLAAGGGGVALGSALLSGATLGVGLMVGGLFINHAGNKAQENVEEARREYNKAKALIEEAVELLKEIEGAATGYLTVLNRISDKYFSLLDWLKDLVEVKTLWSDYTVEEQNKIEHMVLLVTILYKMCSVKFLLKNGDKTKLNKKDIDDVKNIISEQQI